MHYKKCATSAKVNHTRNSYSTKKNEEFSNKPVLFEVIQSTNFYVLARDLRIVSNGHLCFYAFEFQTSSLLLLYFLLSDAADSITQSQFISDSNGLWSTDVVGRVPHQSPTRLPTRRCCIWAFFFPDSCRIGFNSHRFD